MSRKARELETLLLPMIAALPLYLTQTIGVFPLFAFHAAMSAILIRVLLGRGPDLIPGGVMKALAIVFVPFYIVDGLLISRSAIAASTHLVLFIAVYQAIESMRTHNHAQRLLTTALIFIAGLATSTHITVVPFLVAFAFFAFRQLIYISHLETVRSIDREYAEAPSSRTALWYVAGASLLGALLFQLLPRVRNPLVQGLAEQLSAGATGLSETINLNEPRSTTADPTVVARVWMGQQTIPFFTPLRLRGNVYDRFDDGEWKPTGRGLRMVAPRDGVYPLARRAGFSRTATVQMRPQRGRIYIPVGTYAITGLTNLYEGPMYGSYFVYQLRGNDVVSFDTRMAFETEPLRVQRVPMAGYPVTPPVANLARQIVGNATDPRMRAQRIEDYMSSRFQYVADPATLGRRMTVDDFLLRVRRGHCEYFAAGMVALLASLDVPARIAGGFYGGRFNPLTGYFTVRREDAHAWVEVWDGSHWLTFDPTPAALRPGTQKGSLIGAYASALGDSINYFWDRYILTYGLSDQVTLAVDAIMRARETMQSLRASMIGAAQRFSAQRFGLALSIVVAIALIVFLIKRGRRPLHELLAARLEHFDIHLGTAMTMEDALRELRDKHPAAAQEIAPLIALYEEEEFSGRRDRARATTLRRSLGVR